MDDNQDETSHPQSARRPSFIPPGARDLGPVRCSLPLPLIDMNAPGVPSLAMTDTVKQLGELILIEKKRAVESYLVKFEELDTQHNRRLAELALAVEKQQAAEAELAKVNAENARIKQELSKVNAENAHIKQELSKVNAENAHIKQELSKVNAENAHIKQELEVAKADAEKARLETNRYQAQYSSICNALLCADIQVAGTVTMSKRWEDQMRTCIRNQQEIQLQGGPADEYVLREHPGDPDHTNLQFQNLYLALFAIQRFLEAGNKAVRYWRDRALRENPVLGDLSFTRSTIFSSHFSETPTMPPASSPIQAISVSLAHSPDYQPLVPDLLPDTDTIEDVLGLAPPPDHDFLLDSLESHCGQSPYPGPETEDDAVVKEAETQVAENKVEPRPEKSLTPTLSPASSPQNSPQISPQVTGESGNISAHGTGRRKWHLLPAPTTRYPKSFPVSRPPFAPHRTQHRISFIYVGDTPEEDTYNIREVPLPGASRAAQGRDDTAPALN